MSTMQEASDLSKLKEAAGDDAALDTLSIYTIRLLAADMVDKASSGHLGTPFGCAPLANALWGKIMHFSPFQRWLNRDRFVLSVGHASALLYVMLHLTGNGLGGQYDAWRPWFVFVRVWLCGSFPFEPCAVLTPLAIAQDE
ncbi:unnamed protein product [Effrenium voratum]|nr:unnamed protein product [Effrenium voratum]